MNKLNQNYLIHYESQVGGSIPVYAGQVRFQRGMGWFSRLLGGIGNFFKGAAPSIAKRALPSAIGLAQDIVEGQNVGHSALNRLKEAGKNVADETLEQIKKKIQRGEGIPKNFPRNVIFHSNKRKCKRKRYEAKKHKKIFS